MNRIRVVVVVLVMLTFKTFLEIASYTERGTGLLIEIGSLRTLSGGDKDHKMSASSMLLFRAGIIW